MIQRINFYASFYFLALSMLIFNSCAKESSKETGSLRLNEKQMVEIIKDVQVAEGIINYNRNQGRDKDGMKDEYFDLIFKNYKLSPEVLRENIAFYSQKPEILDKIYDSVLLQLKAEQDSLKLDESLKK